MKSISIWQHLLQQQALLTCTRGCKLPVRHHRVWDPGLQRELVHRSPGFVYVFLTQRRLGWGRGRQPRSYLRRRPSRTEWNSPAEGCSTHPWRKRARHGHMVPCCQSPPPVWFPAGIGTRLPAGPARSRRWDRDQVPGMRPALPLTWGPCAGAAVEPAGPAAASGP